MSDIVALQQELEDEFKEMQNLQKIMKKFMESRQQLIEQQSECEIEIDILEEDAKIFKLIGSVLVKQTYKECKGNVDKRIDFVVKELKKLDDSMKENENNQNQRKNKIMKMQDQFLKIKQAMAAGPIQQGK